MRVLSTSMSALAVLIVGLAGAGTAQAGFVPALGSPFSYSAPVVALAVADGDRNGTVDVVAGGGALTLRRGVGTGFLGNPIAVGTSGPVEGVAAGDLDGDGWLDYAAIAPGAGPGDGRQLLRFLAVPGNGFAVQPAVDVGEATALSVANVNDDGLPDIVVVREDDADPGPGGEPGVQDVTVLLGGPNDENAEHHSSEIDAPADVDVGDLDGDGQPEIVVAGDEASVSVLLNEGGGSFADGDLTPTGAAGVSRRIALAQLDGDGRLDLLASDSGAAALLVLRGDGTGGLPPLGAHPSGLPGATLSLAAGDFNGDGATDAVAGGAGGRFAVLLGSGDGGLAPAPGSPFSAWVAAGDPIRDVAAADMNRDGQLDVVTANANGSVSVLLNDETGLLGATPTGVDFGRMLPATGLRTQTVTLRANRGRLRITRLDRQGSKVFTVRDGDCIGRTLLLGQACTLSVTFNAPRRARRYEALLSVDANAAAVVVPLTATTRAPLVRGLRLERKRVARGQRLDLRYGLSEGALTRVLTERALPGRKVGSRCVAPKRGNLERRRCTIWQRVASVTRRDLAGRHRLRVATRERARGVGRKRRPGASHPAGAYRLSISALDRFRNRSEERRVAFKVLRTRG
ncbi:MAG TPA: VCBS repeat-containing protein [Thermoleophilaceae bacterium]|nr:VCBS repeat-containing protein [Thermoleophilaceae bacterium]